MKCNIVLVCLLTFLDGKIIAHQKQFFELSITAIPKILFYHCLSTWTAFTSSFKIPKLHIHPHNSATPNTSQPHGLEAMQEGYFGMFFGAGLHAIGILSVLSRSLVIRHNKVSWWAKAKATKTNIGFLPQDRAFAISILNLFLDMTNYCRWKKLQTV